MLYLIRDAKFVQFEVHKVTWFDVILAGAVLKWSLTYNISLPSFTILHFVCLCQICYEN